MNNDVLVDQLLKRYKSKKFNSITTINDLIVKDGEGEQLTSFQFAALKNYYHWKIKVLKHYEEKKKFSSIVMKISVLSNVIPYKEFI